MRTTTYGLDHSLLGHRPQKYYFAFIIWSRRGTEIPFSADITRCAYRRVLDFLAAW